jgi:hypothetical protein
MAESDAMPKPFRGRLLVCGSRSIRDRGWCERQVEEFIRETAFPMAELVSGGAHGVDRIIETWAKKLGVTVKRFLPNYHRHGKGAPLVRNREMIAYADACLALWDGVSCGTLFTIDNAKAAKMPTTVIEMKSGLIPPGQIPTKLMREVAKRPFGPD